MVAQESIFSKMTDEYNDFTTSEKKMVDYVLDNKAQVQYMSISELADECGVGEATVTRFCKRLSLKGYSDFRLAIAMSIATQEKSKQFGSMESEESRKGEGFDDLYSEIYSDYDQTLRQTMSMLDEEEVKKAIDIFIKSNHVYCMGQGGSSILAMDASHLMSTVSNKFFCVFDSHIQASTAASMTKNDAILFFSYSGSTRDSVDLIKIAKEKGAMIILLTRFHRSPAANLSDVILQCGADESPLHQGSVSAKIAQLYVMDVLFREYCKRDEKGTSEISDNIAKAVAGKHL